MAPAAPIDFDALDPLPHTVVRDAHGIARSVWHGTKHGPFERFRPAGFKQQQLGFGLHCAEERAFADRYATGKKGCVLECLLDIRKPLDVTGFIKPDTAAYAFGRALFKGSRQASRWGMLTLGNGDLWLNLDLFDARRVVRLLQEHGFDGVRYKAQYGARAYNGTGFGVRTTSESIAWVALDPDQVRILGVAPALQPAPQPDSPPRGTAPR